MRNIIMSFAEKFKEKEVKKMKSLFIIVIAITMVISTSGLSFAAFTSEGKVTFSASSGSVGGTPSVTQPFSASLKNISNDANASSVAWSSVAAGVTGWLASNQYIAVQGFATYSDWGIQIYTNNTNYTGTGNPAGLVNTGNTIYSLPMSWRTTTIKVDPADIESAKKLTVTPMVINVGGTDYNVLADGTYNPASPYYPWFYMMDKKPYVDGGTTVTFGDYQDYATFIGSTGYQHAPSDYATPWATDTTYYVYLGANFTMSMPGATYATTTMTVEMYRL